MAKSRGIRKILVELLKKVEALENQNFAQGLLIDDLENKLASAEASIEKMRQDPFGLLGKYAPIVSPIPLPVQQQQQWLPTLQPQYAPQTQHTCTPGWSDLTGGSHCSICGALIINLPIWMAGPTTTDITLPKIDFSDLDISWIPPTK